MMLHCVNLLIWFLYSCFACTGTKRSTCVSLCSLLFIYSKHQIRC